MRRSETAPPSFERADYAYRVFWTKQARQWTVDRRQSVLAAANAVAASVAFEPNPFERRYGVAGVDGAHSGASVMALIQVLEAFDAGATESARRRT